MNKSLLFFVFLCLLIQISKLGFCLERKAHNGNNGLKRHGFISVTSFGAVGDGKADDTKVYIYIYISLFCIDLCIYILSYFNIILYDMYKYISGIS